MPRMRVQIAQQQARGDRARSVRPFCIVQGNDRVLKQSLGDAGLVDKLAAKASTRNMKDQTIGPILSWTTDAMLGHVEKLLKIPGASLAFGGKQLEGHTIPERYGAIVPTAVFVPLKEILKPENFDLVTTEVFGPVQVSFSDQLGGTANRARGLGNFFWVSQTWFAVHNDLCIITISSLLFGLFPSLLTLSLLQNQAIL